MTSPPKRKYNPDSVMQELVTAAIEAYGYDSPHPSLATIAADLGVNPIKTRKLLITAGIYESEIADEVLRLHRLGKTVEEIGTQMNLSRSSVNADLPYTKIVYKAEEVGLTAERLKVFRACKRAMELLQDKMTEEALWDATVVFSDYPLCTAKKLKFKYELKGNEMFVDRKEKSITRSTVELAFQKAMGAE